MGPLHISAETETSNLVCYLGLGISLPKKNFYDQNCQGSGLGEHHQNWDPY